MRSTGCIRALVGAMGLWLVVSTVPGAEPGDDVPAPLDVGQRERVEVQYVLVDLVVLDGKGRTVPGLGREDFRVVLDGQPVEVATLDEDCPLGASDDPRSGAPQPPTTPNRAGSSERLVLAFDYFHMKQPAETLREAAEALEERSVAGDRHMVVSIGETLRVESDFTDDLGATLQTLERMRDDPALYAGHYDSITERRFFRRLLRLFDLMELLEGRKVVVLFSGPFLRDNWSYDPYYASIAAMASRARTAVYPVDSRGLVAEGYRRGQTGGPQKLARIASETGGRFTRNTNDLGLAYARASRDSRCTYTLGFYDRDPVADRDRGLKVFVRRPGLSVRYPSGYVWRSHRRELQSMVRTASMAPELFEDGGLEVHALLRRPLSAKRWEVTLAAGIPATLARRFPAAVDWVLGGALRKPSATLVRDFEQEVDPQSPAAVSASGSRWFYRRLALRPGRYWLSLYLHNSETDRPFATLQPIELPEVPTGGPFLVEPLVGVPDSSTDAAGLGPILPLPGNDLAPDPLPASLARVCVVASRASLPETFVTRTLSSESGVVDRGTPRPVELGLGDDVACDSVVEALPVERMGQGRFTLRFEIGSDDGAVSGDAELELELRAPASAGTERPPARGSGSEHEKQDEHHQPVGHAVGDHRR